VVIDVHNRDVMDDLIKTNVDTIHNFDWISQLRYNTKIEKNIFNIEVRCINAVQNYGFEYLGNSTRYRLFI